MDTNINATGKGLWWRFVASLNKLMNPEHAWTDYQSKQNTMLGDVYETLRDDVGTQVGSLVNRFTDAHMTQGEIERNELQMQNVEDNFQRQVTGMQKAGLNPALMYQNGAGSGSAPSVSTSASSAPNMSGLMQAILLPRQMDLISAQAENLRATAKKSEAQTEKIGEEISLIRSRIENSNLDASQKRIALQYQDDFAKADLAIKAASQENLRASYKATMESISKMKYEELTHVMGYLETIEKISVMEKSKELTDAQIDELAALTGKLNEEKRYIKLQGDNFDLINGFVTNASLGVGPFKGSQSTVVTLKDLKNGVRAAMNEREEPHDSNKDWQEQKREASERYGALE